jgi:hypothetical protein
MAAGTATPRRTALPAPRMSGATCAGVYTFATAGRVAQRGPDDGGGGSGGATTGDGGGATTGTAATTPAASLTHVQTVVFGIRSRRAAGVSPSFRANSTAAALAVAVYCRGCAAPMLILAASTTSRTGVSWGSGQPGGVRVRQEQLLPWRMLDSCTRGFALPWNSLPKIPRPSEAGNFVYTTFSILNVPREQAWFQHEMQASRLIPAEVIATTWARSNCVLAPAPTTAWPTR